MRECFVERGISQQVLLLFSGVQISEFPFYILKISLAKTDNTVKSRFFEPPREMEIGSKNWEFKKSKGHQIRPFFTMVWFYKIQEGRQQW